MKSKQVRRSIRDSAEAGVGKGVQRGIAKVAETAVVVAGTAVIYWTKEHHKEIGDGIRHQSLIMAGRIKNLAQRGRQRLRSGKHRPNEEP